jgi:hypothetical protein
MSTRYGKFSVSIWTKRGNDKEAKDKIFRRIKKLFLMPQLPFDYKVHDLSISLVKKNLDKEEKGLIANQTNELKSI